MYHSALNEHFTMKYTLNCLKYPALLPVQYINMYNLNTCAVGCTEIWLN